MIIIILLLLIIYYYQSYQDSVKIAEKVLHIVSDTDPTRKMMCMCIYKYIHTYT